MLHSEQAHIETPHRKELLLMPKLPMNRYLYVACIAAVCSHFSTSKILCADEVAGRNLAGWKKDLASDNRTVRLRAAKTLGAFGTEAVPTLTELLGDQDVAVQYWAASHLGNMGDAAKSSVHKLKELFDSESQPIRMAVSYALCSIEGVDEWSGPLLEGIESKQREVGCTAADFLARLGPKAKSILGKVEAKHREYLTNKGDYHIRGSLENAVRDIKNDGFLENHKRPKGGGTPRGKNPGKLKTGPGPRGADQARQRPNILWISCEDISPNLGCFGDEYASTPNLDRLASQGVRFTQAFTPAGVCAVVRTGIITGMYPISFGGQHMRSVIKFPEEVKPFPVYLREAGYFCTNKAKTDYQSNVDMNATWDRHGGAHSDWRERKPGQPFFSVINLTCSHESQIRHGEKTHAGMLAKLAPEQRHDPDLAAPFLPPIYPNTPEARKDWAWYADNISEMDRQVGEILQRLEDDGLADNTVVIFWSDHGRGLPRGKRWIYDSGVHVPVIVRWPQVMGQGRVNDELVSTEDLTATTLSLAGVKPKDYMQGRVFLGEGKQPEPEMLFYHRDRMDEAYELMRAARTHRFKYIRNYEPERTYAQHIDYMDMMPTLVDLRQMHKDGKLNAVQERFFAERKPIEELYDVVSDPHETRNLAERPEFQSTLTHLRKSLEEWQVEVGDMGMIPEAIMMESLR